MDNDENVSYFQKAKQIAIGNVGRCDYDEEDDNSDDDEGMIVMLKKKNCRTVRMMQSP